MKQKFGVRRFNGKLAVCGLAAGAALGSSETSEGVPIHVDLADITINLTNPPNLTNPLNLNVSNLVNPTANLPDASLGYVLGDLPAATAAQRPINLQFNSLNNLAEAISTPFNLGDTIGPRTDYVPSFNLGVRQPPDPGFGGAWLGLSNAFLGWQVDIPGGSPHFSWVRLSVDNNLNLTLHDYAVESEANTPIRAGQTAVPEPGSLALLALGAAGLLAWRRARGQG